MLRILATIVLLSFSSIQVAAFSPAESHYPVCSQVKLRVTQENYRDKIHSLAGITGVYVNLQYVKNASKKQGLALTKDLSAEIEQRLRKAGLKSLSKEEVKVTLGQPTFDVFPTYPKTNNPNFSARYNTCCRASVWASFSQGARILRDPHSQFTVSTWGDGDETSDCSDLGEWMTETTLEKLDLFIADYLKAQKQQVAFNDKLENPKPLPKETPVEYPECNSSIILYAELFKTGSDQINPVKRSVLEQLIGLMKNCPKYRYLIETHADQRASHAHNDKLTKRRAETIARYLEANDIKKHQFETASYGKRKLVTQGTSSSDYSANRRVVVIPFQMKE